MFGGAITFSLANASAKTFIDLGGTQGTLMFARGTLAWVLNALIAEVTNGGRFLSVLLIRVANRRQFAILSLGACSNFVCLYLLLLSLDNLISFGDAFGVLIGTFTIATMVMSRALGSSERTTRIEVIGGAITIVGVLCISQPSFLGGGAHQIDSSSSQIDSSSSQIDGSSSQIDGSSSASLAGFFFCVIAGVSVSVFNVVCRYLANAGVSAAIVNSGGMLSIGVLALLILAMSTMATDEPARAATIKLPQSGAAWGWMLLYCLLNTIAQVMHGCRCMLCYIRACVLCAPCAKLSIRFRAAPGHLH